MMNSSEPPRERGATEPLTSSVFARVWRALWYTPVRAERLALVRVTTVLALLGDVVLQQLPHYSELFGLEGFMPEGYSDAALLRSWRWTSYVFDVSGSALGLAFAAWIVAAVALGFGFMTRWAAFATWFLTLAMFHRHYHLKNFGDSVLRVTTFLLLFVPSAGALAWDTARDRRRPRAAWQSPWGVRLFQLQMCAVYTSTGLSKIVGPLESTWYQGTSVHYALNDVVLARWSYASFPLPLWFTLPFSYAVLLWELLFVPLVCWRRTRAWTLAFGVAFHLAVFLCLEVGWFSFYILCWYCAWIPDEWLVRASSLWTRRRTRSSTVHFAARE